ncbi:archaellar assembly protein FlaJ [Halomarina pelagica]|uniref:archaellar assembly protein FlaJ n=1 Tax=Halomarina pelagica TaxID=2961599 RepID=UPI0020C3D339|nr:archaellar assembly protein FlaJ [Halomarina sp. BND7]
MNSERAFEVNLRRAVAAVIDSYRHLGTSLRRYVLLALLPSALFALGGVGATVALSLPLSIGGPLSLLGTFTFVVAVAYPKVVEDRKRKQVRERFHLFLTHVTVLSMTNIDRVEVFRTLAAEEEYRAIAEEMARIVALVDTWNQSLDDACRMRARRVPSDLLADFLERLAYTVGAGQELGDFLVAEQDSMLQQFAIRYEGDLAKLDVLRELYLSLMLSVTFILVFATVLPIIVGVEPTLLVGGVVGLLAVVQCGFLFVVHTVAPYDPVWYASGIDRTPARRVRRTLVAGVAGTALAVAGAAAVRLGVTPVDPAGVPLAAYVAVPVTPLLLPGLAMRREENRVKERDEGFPPFVRALGSVESVKQTSTANVLRTLRRKDFGPLTENVDHLYRRLNTRIDTTRAWRLFAVETGSYLIQKFGDMYVIGRRMGGDPKRLGQVISRNMTEVLKLRERRAQETATFVGVVYGITAASVFSAFVGLEIAVLLTDIAKGFDADNPMMHTLFNPERYDVATMELLLLFVVLLNALVSAVMIRIMDRGHTVNAYHHFVLLTWLGAGVAVVTGELIGSLITV